MPDAPRATYRLQLTETFGFAEATALIDYLAALGISHVYLSPVLLARPGSTHGYDVADARRVSGVLGGEDGLRALAAAARAAGLGVVLDIVPNHVGTGEHTPLWEALLAGGPDGEAARFFDVDWDPPLPGAAGKVLLPVLGDQYGKVLARGELSVAAGRVRYFEHSFPLAEGDAGDGDLHEVLERQHYRLLWWRAGDTLVNYRRFFAITELAGIRVEDEAVFDATHERILALVGDGTADGLRVDHPDGLADPAGYLRRLASRAPEAWIVAEKILAPGERLPDDWPVAGTTGYDFCNDMLGLFADPAAEQSLEGLARRFDAAPERRDLAVAHAKTEVLHADLAAETRRVAARLWTVTQRHPEVRDCDDRACLAVVRRTVEGMHVYRTYVDPFTGHARPEDEAIVDAAVPPTDLGRFFADVLTGRAGTDPEHLEVIRRFQQLSGAAMAKGVEDTYLYRDLRLTGLNEVGAEPGAFGVDPATFHARCAARPPAGMVATATHDTKRGEDTRLRITALSEMSGQWRHAVANWASRHEPDWPSPAAAYLLYQTLVGVWPLDPVADPATTLGTRVHDYVLKAEREAKVRTSWSAADEAYEQALHAFVDLLLDPIRSDVFHAEMVTVAARAATIAMVSSLSSTLLRCTVPGVPDTYQGTELWDTSLVDPDNRRPVAFGTRRRMLAELDAADPSELLAHWPDGRIKLWVLTQALRARAASPGAFAPGASYEPLTVTGRWAGRVVGFARHAADGSETVVAVAPRLAGAVMGGDAALPLGDRWHDTEVGLPVGGWTDLLTGSGRKSGRVAELCSTLPLALLRKD
jgi:malto-oligosyltrehalose synthase